MLRSLVKRLLQLLASELALLTIKQTCHWVKNIKIYQYITSFFYIIWVHFFMSHNFFQMEKWLGFFWLFRLLIGLYLTSLKFPLKIFSMGTGHSGSLARVRGFLKVWGWLPIDCTFPLLGLAPLYILLWRNRCYPTLLSPTLRERCGRNIEVLNNRAYRNNSWQPCYFTTDRML